MYIFYIAASLNSWVTDCIIIKMLFSSRKTIIMFIWKIVVCYTVHMCFSVMEYLWWFCLFNSWMDVRQHIRADLNLVEPSAIVSSLSRRILRPDLLCWNESVDFLQTSDYFEFLWTEKLQEDAAKMLQGVSGDDVIMMKHNFFFTQRFVYKKRKLLFRNS